jgi:hypothetical protein
LSRIGPRSPLPIGLLPRLSIDELLWVANTRHGPGGHWFARVTNDAADHDHLLEPADAVDYLDRHGVPLPTEAPSARQLNQLGVIRDMISGLPDPARPAWSPEGLAILASTRFAAGADGTIRADATGWNAFIRDLMLPLIQLVEVRQYLRLCGNPHCRLIFLDISRNHSRRWCDTSGCGNRDRVRRYRGTHAQA